ncbi:putative enterotoxin [Cordyceps sp. RAO-2017]|nr:putative enterotoxin [Cordyceps sp. RAO-2017]
MLFTTLVLFLGLVQAAPSPGGKDKKGGRTASTPAPSDPGFVWRGERSFPGGRTPDDVRRSGGMWALGSQIDGLTPEQLETGSSLWMHAGSSQRQYSQYVSTTTSITVGLDFATRGSQGRVGYLYRIRTNWAAIDMNRSLGDASPYTEQLEQAFAQGIPWSQVLGWYEVTLADFNRAHGTDDPIAELGTFHRNPDFRPDATEASGAQPQLAAVPPSFRIGTNRPWEPFVGQSAAENLEAFIRSHGPPVDAAAQATLRSINWGAIRIPERLRATVSQGAASAAQCAMAAAALLVQWKRHDELKRSVEGSYLAPRAVAGASISEAAAARTLQTDGS